MNEDELEANSGKMSQVKRIALYAGPLVGLLFWALMRGFGLEQAPSLTAGIGGWVAVWWVFEPISIPATSMIPFVAFPLSGVLSNKEVAQAYGHWLILLLLGGFLLSAGME